MEDTLKRDLVNNSEGEWTEIIQAKSSWYDLKLKELWDYRELIMIFVHRDVVSTYKQTILGPIWFFIGPVFTIITYTFVFGNIANIPTDGVPAPLFYLAGTTLWNYFQTSFTGTSNTFVTNASIFGKVYFPRLILPISTVMSNLLKFGIQMLMFLLFWSYYYYKGDVSPNSGLLLFPILVFLMGGLSLSIGIIISALTTKYRDLTFLVGFGVSLLMFASPVIYPASAIPAKYKLFLAWNPLAPIIEAFRYGFTGYGTLSIEGLLYSFGFMVVTLFIGMMMFSRIEKTFMDTV